jgi:hypothetical protein
MKQVCLAEAVGGDQGLMTVSKNVQQSLSSGLHLSSQRGGRKVRHGGISERRHGVGGHFG